MESIEEALHLDPVNMYILATRTVLLQALGRYEAAQEMMRKARKLVADAPLDFWVDSFRGSYMSETMFTSYLQQFIDVWNATPIEAE